MFLRLGKLSSFFSWKTGKRFLYLTFDHIREIQSASTQKRTGGGTKVRKKIKMADQVIAVRTGSRVTWG